MEVYLVEILMQEQASWDHKKALILLCFMNELPSLVHMWSGIVLVVWSWVYQGFE